MKIAIIGSGITGNSAAWLLNEAGHDIAVFEKNDYSGGHSNTVSGDNHSDVDTGFIVYNEATYPNLIALFDMLGVQREKTDMSFAVSLFKGAYEYSGDALFGQLSNFFKPSHYKMLADVVRFYKRSPELLNEADQKITLGEYLRREKYSQAFADRHILPMAAAIWSTSSDDVRDFPAASFVRFFVNHGLMKLSGRPQWWTVSGGSRQYVKKLTQGFQDKIRLNVPATSVERKDDCVLVNGEKFDHVIVATHTDQALSILKDASDEERDVLGAFPYSENVAYLHSDEALMPRRKKIWSSWNYISEGDGQDQSLCLSYWMNLLQPFVGADQNLFVTLNPPKPPQSDKVHKVITYHHPQYTPSALSGWSKLKAIQGVNRTWFCGAWCGYGFHEDGISAGLSVAESLSGVKRPWDITESSPAGDNAKPEQSVIKDAA